jgi:hypothetical protein
MRTPKTEEEILLIIKPLYEVLDSFGVRRYRIDNKGVELHKDGKIFGYLDYEKSIYLRIKPLPSGDYPSDSNLYEGQRYKMIDLRSPIDKEYVLEEIRKAYEVASE